MTTAELIKQLQETDPTGLGEVILFGNEQGFDWYCAVKQVGVSGPPRNPKAAGDPIIECGEVISVG